MEQEKLVSVIIPTFKSAQFLYESIYSIVNQTYENLEIIIVDDTPSDDGTKDILDSFNDQRIIYIKPQNRLGMVKSLNYAVSISRGAYIARMDADDISHKDRIKLQVEYLERHPEVGVIGCNCYTINKNRKIIGSIIHPENNIDIKTKMMFNVAFVHPSVVIRKKLLLNNLYNEQCYCCEDYELWSRLMHKTDFHNLPTKLFKYRILTDSAMQSQLQKLQQDDIYYKKHIAILKIAYDNVLYYFNKKGSKNDVNYVELTFSKRISDFSISKREKFLANYENIIRTKNNSKYVNKCISYQWLNMTKYEFWKTTHVDWLLGCVGEILKAFIEKSNSVIIGFISNKNISEWKL